MEHGSSKYPPGEKQQSLGRLTRLRGVQESPAGSEDAESSGYRLHRRFDRMGRLVGDAGMAKLFSSHVMVIGLGGVGSWAAEALARSGVGQISLVDFDLVCVTNGNRQLHALRGTTGKPKVSIMADRMIQIHPGCHVEAVAEFYNQETSEKILRSKPDLIIDAIDNLTAKAHLIATSKNRRIPIVVSGGASGRLDPTAIRESEMSEVKADPFLSTLRKILRKNYNFSRDKSWDIPAIHSLEAPRNPVELHYDGGQGFRCVCPQGQNDLHSCDSRHLIYGTAGFVTGAFGLACTATATRILLAAGT